jgi:hypothetical protein
MMAL